MRPPRGLSAEEAALWARVARTVTPLEGRVPPPTGEGDRREAVVEGNRHHFRPLRGPAKPPVPLHHASHGPPPRAGEERRPLDQFGLDASWDRKLARGLVPPDFTLDLHGASLDAAHARLDRGLAQAKAMGARVVLIVTGKPRNVEPGERGRQRGAIRAKIGDWLAASEHAFDIAAIRGAHRRHGGAGALYIVLRRPR